MNVAPDWLVRGGAAAVAGEVVFVGVMAFMATRGGGGGGGDAAAAAEPPPPAAAAARDDAERAEASELSNAIKDLS